MPSSHSFRPPTTKHPLRSAHGRFDRSTVFLNAVIDHPRWCIGDYSYAHAFQPPKDWAAHLAPYLYDFSSEKLRIEKFCQIADGVTFVTATANHRYDGFSSFPFAIFDDEPKEGRPSLPAPGADTELGHDVWLGQGATVLPGARIGHGVIIGAGAVVAGTVPPYSVVGGNPGKVIRRRFDEAVIDALLELAWWNWPIDVVLAHEAAICGANLEALKGARPG